MQGVVLLHDDESQESKKCREESFAEVTFSRFSFNKSNKNTSNIFFYLSLTHIFPIIILSLRTLPPYLFDFIQAPFGSSAGHGKNPQNHQGPRTCFWFVWFCLFSRCVLLCFCLLERIFPAQSIPPTPHHVQVP